MLGGAIALRPAGAQGEPRARDLPHLLSPRPPSGLALPPRISAVEAGFDPAMERGCRLRSAPEARAAGGRGAASTPGRGWRGRALLPGDFPASTRILPSALPADSVLPGDHGRGLPDPSLGRVGGGGGEGCQMLTHEGPRRLPGVPEAVTEETKPE